MKNMPQVWEETANGGGYTHRFDLSWRDLFGVTIGTNTDKAFTIVDPVRAGDQITQVHLHLTTPFADASDSAFNSITLDFGDENSATRYLSGVEIDVNGSEVIDTYMDPGSDYIYTADDSLIVNLNSMGGKDLTNVDVGKLYIEYTLLRHGAVSNPWKNPRD